jgi:hypothetical protein
VPMRGTTKQRRWGCLSGLFWALMALAIPSWADPLNDNIEVTCTVGQGDAWLRFPMPQVTWDGVVIPGMLTRVNSCILNCEYFSANGPWSIKVYHTNGPGKNALSGVAFVDGAWKTNDLQTKVWCPSLGPLDYYSLGYLPNPMDDGVWANSIGVYDQIAPLTFVHQYWQIPSPIQFHFVINAADAYATTYKGKIFFELVPQP